MQKIIGAGVLALILTGCGGGGGGSTSSGTTAGAPSTPSPTQLSTVTFADGLVPWFHTQQTTVGGSETLILSTIDSANIRSLSAPTPMVAVKASTSGVTDATSQVFETIPKTYWSRNLVPFKDDSGNLAIYVCNQGRETTSPSSANGQDGVWAEQDRLLVMRNGKYFDESSKLPQAIDFTHGCTVANMGDGKATFQYQPKLSRNKVTVQQPAT